MSVNSSAQGRVPLIAGNWKMNLDHLQSIAFVQKLAWSLKDAHHDFAAVEVAVPELLVRTARYCLPLSAAAVAKLYVGEVAPAMLVKLAPLSDDTCHCTVGVGDPAEATVKVAVAPADTD